MIVVTGASGNLGRAIVLGLLTRMDATQVGASTRDPDKAAGDPITSCVVEPAGDPPWSPRAAQPKGPKLPDRVRLGLDVLVDCCLSSGEALPSACAIPGNPRAVKAAAWRDEMFRRGVLDRDAKNPREDFARVKRALLARGLTGERDGLVWAV